MKTTITADTVETLKRIDLVVKDHDAALRALARIAATPPLPITKKERLLLENMSRMLERIGRTTLRDRLRELGRQGGKASAAKLTAAQRRKRASEAGKAGGRGRAKKGGKR